MQLFLKWTLLEEIFNYLIYYFSTTRINFACRIRFNSIVLSDMFATSIGVKNS